MNEGEQNAGGLKDPCAAAICAEQMHDTTLTRQTMSAADAFIVFNDGCGGTLDRGNSKLSTQQVDALTSVG